MTDRTGRAALRTARAARGWSQSDAARHLRALAHDRGGPDASPASLKTQLSRWENGHAVPEPAYRFLLAELYGRSPEELGLVPEPEQIGAATADLLRARLAAAAAVDDGVLGLWVAQLAVARRLDDELGAAGTADTVRAQTELLARTLAHTVSPARRGAVAAVLSDTAALSGRHALDQADTEAAWSHYGTAYSAAQETGSPSAESIALAGQAEVLREVGAAGGAVDLLGHPRPDGPPDAQVRLAAALGAAHAALGDVAAARRAFAVARRALPHPDRAHPDAPGAADLDRWHGHALVDLQDPTAVGLLRSALSAEPRAARHRAALHADLARALTISGRPEDARPHAHTARRLAERIGSLRITAQLSPSAGPRGL